MDVIFDPSLMLYLPLYRLDGAPIKSQDAYGHLCTVTGALWRHWGRYFDGNDDKIVAAQPWGDVNFKTMPFSIEMWIKADTLDSWDSLLTIKPTTATNFCAQTVIVPPGKPAFIFVRADNNTTGRVVILSDDSLSVDNWYHLVFTYDSNGTPDVNTALIYINGLLVGTSISGGNINVSTAAVNSFTFGLLASDATLDGLMGEACVYGRVLSRQEIQHNYLATKWRYR